ncbi:MAG: response regulator [Burkholderiales bacterium]|nr:response regulator [Burkholderiales bacterium]
MRVFLVEDSPLVRERLQAMLAGIEGARAVGSAATAREAIDGIRAEHPDVVLLDLKLAEGSGLDVLRALRAQDAPAESAAIYVLSNFAEAPYRRLAENLGAQDFFDKTTEFERMRDALASRAQGIRSDRVH